MAEIKNYKAYVSLILEKGRKIESNFRFSTDDVTAVRNKLEQAIRNEVEGANAESTYVVLRLDDILNDEMKAFNAAFNIGCVAQTIVVQRFKVVGYKVEIIAIDRAMGLGLGLSSSQPAQTNT